MRVASLALAALLVAGCGGQSAGPVKEIRIPLGAGGVGFLPLLVMRDRNLIEKHAQAAGLAELKVRWIELGGPAVMNDALLSGSVDFIAAGPPAFITLWDRTRGSADVRGVAAMSSLPMYLNTTNPALKSLDDLNATGQDRRHGRQGVDPVDRHADVRGREVRRGRSVSLRPVHGDDDITPTL